jgi:phage terminase large subunit
VTAARAAKTRAIAQRNTTFALEAPAIWVELTGIGSVRWPLTEYQEDPVGFVRNVLGVEPWDKQIEILEAIRDGIFGRNDRKKRTTVGSGHKVGKSALAIMLASWFFCCFPDARVVMTSTTAAQVDRILWRELRMQWARAGRCTVCKAEDPDGFRITRPCPHSVIIPEADKVPELARTGVNAVDFRQIFGFSSKEAEAVAGISGPKLFYIVDEASGVPETIFEAIDGNRMAGAFLVMFSNCTRNEGTHFDSFHGKSELYNTFRISSEETPNCTGRGKSVPGLADPVMIAEYEREHGRDSSWFKVRVLGEHALHDDGKIFSVGAIAEAEQRWEDTEPSGRLVVGVDPAGASGTGDDVALCGRRGQKVVAKLERKGLDAEATLSEVRAMIRTHHPKDEKEKPLVVLDGGGEVGVKVARRFRDAELDGEFDLVVMQLGSAATREVKAYDRMRDLLAGILHDWIKNGGALIADVKLQAELHIFEWRTDKQGRQKLHPAKDGVDGVRRLLGRSCDRYDALALCVWEPTARELALEAPAVTDPYEMRTGGEGERRAARARDEDPGSNTASNWTRGMY